jgi:hypothetical protein
MLESPSIPAAELVGARPNGDGWLEVEILLGGQDAAHPRAVAISRVLAVDCPNRRYRFMRMREYGADGVALLDKDIGSDAVVTEGPQWALFSQVCPAVPLRDAEEARRQADFDGIDGFLRLAETWPEPLRAPPPEVVRQ